MKSNKTKNEVLKEESKKKFVDITSHAIVVEYLHREKVDSARYGASPALLSETMLDLLHSEQSLSAGEESGSCASTSQAAEKMNANQDLER